MRRDAKQLSNKQRVFVFEYLQCWNAAEAARRAGYSEKTARAIGYENLTKPYIREEIDRRMDELAMGASEVLYRLSAMGRADISQFVKKGGGIDWEKVEAQGFLVKKIKHNIGQNSEIELHDAQAALVQLGKHHALFTDKVDTGGKTIRVIGGADLGSI